MEIIGLKKIDKEVFEQAYKARDETIRERVKNTLDIENLKTKMKSEVFQDSDLLESLACLVAKLKNKLINYDTVVSDEASGRLVSRLLHELVNVKKEQEGKEKAPIYFIAGGRSRHPKAERDVNDFISEKKNTLGRTLLVTEYIETGSTIKFLANILKAHGINFDIATVSLGQEPLKYKMNPARDAIYGSIGMTGASSLYLKYKATGVQRAEKRGPHPIRSELRDPKDVKKSREDIQTLATAFSKLL
ncbi:hypothetical protein MYX06_02220 [Patescibacteria group bacterium AH-259-L05]|nr:hypothetical protein [Patescibacteria group bacterium AH-259-L05]